MFHDSFIKVGRETKSPFITNPYRFAAGGLVIDKSNLKAYYKFNEASGDVINQATSVGSSDAITSSDLTVTGATYQAAGQGDFTYGMSFDGTTDKAVSQSANTTWQFMSDQNDATVCFWINPIGTVVNGKAIMATVNSGANSGFIFDYRSTGDLRFLTEKSASPTGNVNWTAPNLVAGTWTFVVHRHNNSSNIFELFTDNTDHGNNPATVPTANAPDATLQLMDTDYTGAAGGVLSEMTFWERALTDDEISDLYNSGSGAEL
jgi:hypothetical protein